MLSEAILPGFQDRCDESNVKTNVIGEIHTVGLLFNYIRSAAACNSAVVYLCILRLHYAKPVMYIAFSINHKFFVITIFL